VLGESTIAFATLFLGLVRGVQPVELVVVPPATRVEVVLDGAKVNELVASPWQVDVDFGPGLLPHILEAVAYNANGRKVGHVRQAINLARSEAELEIALELDRSGAPKSAQLSWKAALLQRPSHMVVVLDGKEVEVDSKGRAKLPNVELREAHVLRGEVFFGERASASRELVFGGEYSEASSTQLTAVGVEVRQEGAALSVDSVQGALRAGGKPVSVVAIDQPSVTVALIVSAGARERWRAVLGPFASMSGATSMTPQSFDGQPQWRDLLPEPGIRDLGTDCLVAVSSAPGQARAGNGESAEVFASTAVRRWRHRYFLQTANGVRRPPIDPTQQNLVGAVAVAGRAAFASRQRRAVVLVASESELGGRVALAPVVLEYLRVLGVPLFVWVPWKIENPASCAGWGKVVPVHKTGLMSKAAKELYKVIENQRVVWIDGAFLPQQIALEGENLPFELLQ
jgi:hypothetical protein